MVEEDEVQKISYQLQLQQSAGEAVKQQIQAIQANIVEIGSVIEAVKNLKKMKGDTLVPLGAGTFISCPKPNPEKVIISIGANLMVQKSPEDAIKLLQERQQKLYDTLKAAQQDLEQIAKNIQDLANKASVLAAEESKNVRPSEK
ncbi:MAG: prefoldin subunit alpha [Candidatus Anstonellaceae archaeon]